MTTLAMTKAAMLAKRIERALAAQEPAGLRELAIELDVLVRGENWSAAQLLALRTQVTLLNSHAAASRTAALRALAGHRQSRAGVASYQAVALQQR